MEIVMILLLANVLAGAIGIIRDKKRDKSVPICAKKDNRRKRYE